MPGDVRGDVFLDGCSREVLRLLLFRQRGDSGWVGE
jgi:hypothetical protein